MNTKLLKNKIAVISGASRGIGKGIALRFAKEGASLVLICFKNEALLNQVSKEAREIGAKTLIIIGDISNVTFCESVLEKTMSEFGSVDILVNCAGIITRTPFEEMSLVDWNRVIDVNLHGTFNLCRMFLPSMRIQKHGKVINVTSQMAFLPHPGASPSYEVSKAAITALTRHLSLQYAKYNVCINAIAPGSIDTDLPKSMPQEARSKIENSIPMLRLGDTEEVGDCALFLASSMSGYITGTTLHINGGSLML
jgi:3-oxoacyl-[acyl-carrier protein] reductase